MKSDLEEITLSDVNRIGEKLLNNYLAKIKQAADIIDLYNAYIKETNSYKTDHNVKYFYNSKTGDLTYSVTKKNKIGF